MDNYITGAAIRTLREAKKLTQAALGEKIGVSAKAVSKWETAKGLPDITLIEPLAQALGVSVMELMAGEQIVNRNASANLLRGRFYVCPVCGNVIYATGSAAISCCGIALPPLEAEEPDGEHAVTVTPVEDEHYVTVRHPMERTHYIRFLAYVTTDRVQLVRLYPEGDCGTRLQLRGTGALYACCSRHGLVRIRR